MTDTIFDRRGIQIIHADAEAISWPMDIDLIVTDPPYGKDATSARGGRTSGKKIVGDDDQDKIDRILSACWGRIRPHRHAYVFGPNRHLSNSNSAELIWDKNYHSSGSIGGIWSPAHEPIQFFVHRYKSEPAAGLLSARLRRGSIIRVSAGRGSQRLGYHPNEKPVDLWRWLIESSSVPGDLVVDPFCGSGSSALAAILLGRRYLGVDVDLGWVEQAVKRADALIAAIDGALR